MTFATFSDTVPWYASGRYSRETIKEYTQKEKERKTAAVLVLNIHRLKTNYAEKTQTLAKQSNIYTLTQTQVFHNKSKSKVKKQWTLNK